jgi:outer membrane protein insertion porin family/translocation and assembly module TamA
MANLDCVRTTAELTRHNIFRTASRLELRARVSKIGADQLCPGLTARDPYSQTLNYYISTTVTQPFIFRTRFVPTYTLYQERRGEYRAFLREAPIGVSASFSRAVTSRALNLGYSIELGRTEAQPALFCAVFNACVATDREALQRLQRLAVVSAATSYALTDDAIAPSRGLAVSGDIRYASKFVGSDAALEFARFSLDGSVYRRISDDIILAMRLRVGGVVGPTFAIDAKERFVPAQERLFAGGPTTVRGFRQNELGPAVYIPEVYDTLDVTGGKVSGFDVGDTVYFQASDSGGRRAVPTGGNAMVVGNIELRFDSPVFPELVSLVAFADAGRVWNRGLGADRLRFTTLAVTPGFGVRVRTPVGQIRADVGYNQYRPTAGAAYFDAPLTDGGALYCVSPGNTLAVTKVVENGMARIVQAGGACPGTYQPRRAENFLSRLTLAFAIGQAF